MIRHKNRPKIWKIGFLGPSVTDEGSPFPDPIPSMVFPTVHQVAWVKGWGSCIQDHIFSGPRIGYLLLRKKLPPKI